MISKFCAFSGVSGTVIDSRITLIWERQFLSLRRETIGEKASGRSAEGAEGVRCVENLCREVHHGVLLGWPATPRWCPTSGRAEETPLLYRRSFFLEDEKDRSIWTRVRRTRSIESTWHGSGAEAF